ncbi:MAG: hypothetical protein Q7I98_04735, partial [Erysipelotrichaceae bacterium]|nr:hypothetical protein [Erysipelotrichaceae bacterium]
MDRTAKIFDNVISEDVVKKANRTKQKYIKKFGDDSDVVYNLSVEDNQVLYPLLGVKNIVTSETAEKISKEKGIIIGNIRMGFGHYRISMAIASAAHSMGITPYWFDLHAYSETTGGKVIKHLNELYSMGSRWSQKYPLFNKFYWEPLNSEGFKKISYNAMDQKVSELMTPVFKELPKDMPFVATHVWPAQAAVHAGVKRVVNVIPDNWPMALHLAQGSIHTVQTPSSFIGYKTLREMGGKVLLNPMPSDQLFDVGHYIDHELVENIDIDCERRLSRIQNKKTKRILLTVGGAGAQKEIFAEIIKSLLPKIANNEVALLINVGDHMSVWEGLCQEIPKLKALSETYFDDWNKTLNFAEELLDSDVKGIHTFYNKDIFAAVYSSNLLMRSADVLVTKPSELAFYPVPKLMIKRVGGHEAWGAIRAAEVG